jgi:hypothetical protein
LAASRTLLWTWEGEPESSSGIGPWLGGYQLCEGGEENTFRWSDGASFGYTSWASGEPNHWGGNETRISFYSSIGSLTDNSWNDYPNDATIAPYHSGPNPHGYIVKIVFQ